MSHQSDSALSGYALEPRFKFALRGFRPFSLVCWEDSFIVGGLRGLVRVVGQQIEVLDESVRATALAITQRGLVGADSYSHRLFQLKGSQVQFLDPQFQFSCYALCEFNSRVHLGLVDANRISIVDWERGTCSMVVELKRVTGLAPAGDKLVASNSEQIRVYSKEYSLLQQVPCQGHAFSVRMVGSRVLASTEYGAVLVVQLEARLVVKLAQYPHSEVCLGTEGLPAGLVAVVRPCAGEIELCRLILAPQ